MTIGVGAALLGVALALVLGSIAALAVKPAAIVADRLIEILSEAMIRPKPRRATKPTFGSKQRRLEGKKRRSDIKSKRGGHFDD